MRLANLNFNEKLILITSCLLLLIATQFSIGFFHPDEHYQILEFALWKLNLLDQGELSWEFTEQIRPTLQPYFVCLMYKTLEFFNLTDPFFLAFVLRLISSGFSFFVMLHLYQSYKEDYKEQRLKNIFLYLCFLNWFWVFNSVRFSSENWSGALILLCLSYFKRNLKKDNKFYFNLGLLAGLSFLFRYQTLIMTSGLFLWLALMKKEKYSHLSSFLLSFSLLFSLNFFMDQTFYNEWTLSLWNYFKQNILLSKASNYGTSPWWSYFSLTLVKAIPPFSLVLIFSFLIYFFYKPKTIITWTLLPFFLVHFIIGHKELRFFFPIIGFIPIIICSALEIVNKRYFKKLFESKVFLLTFRIIIFLNTLALGVVLFKPANHLVLLYKIIYDRYPKNTTLYYTDKNPYQKTSETISLYKRNNLTTRPIDQSKVTLIKKGDLIITNHKKPFQKTKIKIKEVYTTFPKWILKYNVNNWVERLKPLTLYEVIG